MRVKTVKRYYCDHCGRGRAREYDCAKHERGCTANPNRVCGMCEASGGDNVLDELKALLPREADYPPVPIHEGAWLMDYSAIRDAAEKALPDLIHAAEMCPACIMAALRQTGLLGHAEWDYKKAYDDFWKEVNFHKDYPR